MSKAKSFVIRRLIIIFTLIFAGIIMSEGRSLPADREPAASESSASRAGVLVADRQTASSTR